MSRLASEEENTPTFLNPWSLVGVVGNHNSERRLGGVMVPKDGVEVGGVVATKQTFSRCRLVAEEVKKHQEQAVLFAFPSKSHLLPRQLLQKANRPRRNQHLLY